MQLAPSHKDFSPRNLKINPKSSKLVILDAEHFALAPIFYDQTYFLTSLWLKDGTQGMQFFQKLVEVEAENLEFHDQFVPVLTSRLIGVSWDEKNDKHQLENLLTLTKFWEELYLTHFASTANF